jgi:hypothetical protein
MDVVLGFLGRRLTGTILDQARGSGGAETNYFQDGLEDRRTPERGGREVAGRRSPRGESLQEMGWVGGRTSSGKVGVCGIEFWKGGVEPPHSMGRRGGGGWQAQSSGEGWSCYAAAALDTVPVIDALIHSEVRRVAVMRRAEDDV